MKGRKQDMIKEVKKEVGPDKPMVVFGHHDLRKVAFEWKQLEEDQKQSDTTPQNQDTNKA